MPANPETVTYRTPSWSTDGGVRAAGHDEAIDPTIAAKLRRVKAVLVEPASPPAAPSSVSLQDAAHHLLNAQGLDMPDEVRQILQGFAGVSEPAKTTARKSSPKKTPAKSAS